MLSLPVVFAYSIYEIFTIMLYIRILMALLWNPNKFAGSFYRFIVVIGILDITHFLLELIFYRPAITELTIRFYAQSVPSRLLSIPLFLIYFVSYQILFLHIAISANRWTGFWMPLKHKKIWTKCWRSVVFVSFMVSFLLTAHRLFATSQYVPLLDKQPEAGYLPMPVQYDYYSLNTNLLTAALLVVGVVCCVILNGATLVKILLLKRQKVFVPGSFQQIDRDLFIIALWLTFLHIILIIFQGSLFALRAGLVPSTCWLSEYRLFQIQPLINDIVFLGLPWMLVFVNKPIRQHVLPYFPWDIIPRQLAWWSKSNTGTVAPSAGVQNMH